MKLIFDFDDTLSDTKRFKERLFSSLENIGIPRIIGEAEYEKIKSAGVCFSLKTFLNSILKANNFNQKKLQSLYEEISEIFPSLLDKNLIEIVKRLGRQNCYIVTYGDNEYQMEKIKKSGIISLFQEIYTTSTSKKEIVEQLCAKYSNEKIIFIDDKVHHFENLDIKKYPNLVPVLYDEKGLEKLNSILSSL